MNKNVLMIANDFPPIGGSGIQRAFYFAKYLEGSGWQPTALTVKEVLFPAKDASLLEQLPPCVRVVRTESLELRRVAWLLGRLIRRPRRSPSGTATTAAPSPMAIGPRSHELGRALKRWLFVPDDRMLWAPFALLEAMRAVRREGISLLFATAPPYSSAVIGWILQRLTGLPLVIDLRDPWTDNPYLLSPTAVHRRLNRWLERKSFAAAARLIVISPAMRAGVLEKHPALPADKVTVILNGFDAEEFAGTEPLERDPGFVTAYVGSLYAHHQESIRAFCSAWSELAAENPAFRQDAKLWLVGRCDPEIEEELASWETVNARILGYKRHGEAIRYLKTGSMLLLLIRDLDPRTDLITIPGKLFEYLGAGVPILMIGPEGDAADIVRGHGGFVCRQDDGAGIRDAISRLYAAPPGWTAPASATAEVTCYDRRSLAMRLAAELDAIVSDRAKHDLRTR